MRRRTFKTYLQALWPEQIASDTPNNLRPTS